MTATTTQGSRYDGATLVRSFASGELSPVTVAEEIIADVETRNPAINAFTDFDPAQVLRDARASEHRWSSGAPLGPIDGVPCTVKENLYRAGVAAHAGTAAGEPTIPTRSSPIVERILEQGATAEIYDNPANDYTRSLIEATPTIRHRQETA